MLESDLEAFGEVCRRMAAEQYLAADDSRTRARRYPGISDLYEREAAELDARGDVFAWYYQKCTSVTACDCRPGGGPCPDFRGRDLVLSPRVTFLKTEPLRWFDVRWSWPGPAFAVADYVPLTRPPLIVTEGGPDGR
jgi:hypothetical protein